MTTVSTAFQGRTLRSGVHYVNLQNHLFSTDEKIWLCKLIMEPNQSTRQIARKVLLYCNRHSISELCVNNWILLQSLGIEQLPGFCLSEGDNVMDEVSLAAIARYDAIGRQESETSEAHLFRWTEFIRLQETQTVKRHQVASSNQRKRLRIKSY
jgi:hypothetical protein